MMELHFDDTGGFAHIRLSGPLTREVILRSFDATVSDERYRPGMGRLWDFRNADLSSLDAATIAEMARYSTRFPPGVNDVPVAFVTSRRLEYGLTRMFQAFSDSAATTVSVFDSMEAAEEWLAGGGSAAPDSA